MRTLVLGFLLCLIPLARPKAEQWVPVRSSALALAASTDYVWVAGIEDTDGQGPLVAWSVDGDTWQYKSARSKATASEYLVSTPYALAAVGSSAVVALEVWSTSGGGMDGVRRYAVSGSIEQSWGFDQEFGVPSRRLFQVGGSVYSENTSTRYCYQAATLVLRAGPQVSYFPLPALWENQSCTDCSQFLTCNPAAVLAFASNGPDTFAYAEFDAGSGVQTTHLLKLTESGWQIDNSVLSVEELESYQEEVYLAGVLAGDSGSDRSLAVHRNQTWESVTGAVPSEVVQVFDLQPFGNQLFYTAQHTGSAEIQIYSWDGVTIRHRGSVTGDSTENVGQLAATSSHLFVLGDQVYRLDQSVGTRQTSFSALRAAFGQ